MVAETKESSVSVKVAATEAPADVASATVVKKKNKKRKYSSGMRSVQEFERGSTRAAREIGKAVSKGLSLYTKRSNKSSRKRRDGAVRDMIENVGKSLGKGLRAGSDAPNQFAKAVNSRRFSKQVRDALRMVAPPLFR